MYLLRGHLGSKLLSRGHLRSNIVFKVKRGQSNFYEVIWGQIYCFRCNGVVTTFSGSFWGHTNFLGQVFSVFNLLKGPIRVKAGRKFTIKIPFEANSGSSIRWIRDDDAPNGPKAISSEFKIYSRYKNRKSINASNRKPLESSDSTSLYVSSPELEDTGRYHIQLLDGNYRDQVKLHLLVVNVPGPPVDPTVSKKIISAKWLLSVNKAGSAYRRTNIFTRNFANN